MIHSNSNEKACLITSDLNLSFSSVSLSQKIEDEFPKEVFSRLPSIKIQDHQFESIFNYPKDLIDYNSCRMCVVFHAIYNIMTKIRGRIFLKRGGMMRSDKRHQENRLMNGSRPVLAKSCFLNNIKCA